MKGILYILVVYLAGDLLSRLMGGFMPASVLGMVVLFVALKTKVIKPKEVKSISNMLLDNMILFFVPIAVGLIAAYKIIGSNLVAIAVILVVTTLLVIAVVGWTQQIGGSRNGK